MRRSTPMPVRQFHPVDDEDEDSPENSEGREGIEGSEGSIITAPVAARTTRKAECRGRPKASCVRTRACTFVSSTKIRDHCRARPVRQPKVREEPMTVNELNDPANINKPFMVSIGAPLKMRVDDSA